MRKGNPWSPFVINLDINEISETTTANVAAVRGYVQRIIRVVHSYTRD